MYAKITYVKKRFIPIEPTENLYCYFNECGNIKKEIKEISNFSLNKFIIEYSIVDIILFFILTLCLLFSLIGTQNSLKSSLITISSTVIFGLLIKNTLQYYHFYFYQKYLASYLYWFYKATLIAPFKDLLSLYQTKITENNTIDELENQFNMFQTFVSGKPNVQIKSINSSLQKERQIEKMEIYKQLGIYNDILDEINQTDNKVKSKTNDQQWIESNNVICKTCGQKNEDKNFFCKNCGNPINKPNIENNNPS